MGTARGEKTGAEERRVNATSELVQTKMKNGSCCLCCASPSVAAVSSRMVCSESSTFVRINDTGVRPTHFEPQVFVSHCHLRRCQSS